MTVKNISNSASCESRSDIHGFDVVHDVISICQIPDINRTEVTTPNMLSDHRIHAQPPLDVFSGGRIEEFPFGNSMTCHVFRESEVVNLGKVIENYSQSDDERTYRLSPRHSPETVYTHVVLNRTERTSQHHAVAI
jgi:hypothetical protein